MPGGLRLRTGDAHLADVRPVPVEGHGWGRGALGVRHRLGGLIRSQPSRRDPSLAQSHPSRPHCASRRRTAVVVASLRRASVVQRAVLVGVSVLLEEVSQVHREEHLLTVLVLAGNGH